MKLLCVCCDTQDSVKYWAQAGLLMPRSTDGIVHTFGLSRGQTHFLLAKVMKEVFIKIGAQVGPGLPSTGKTRS